MTRDLDRELINRRRDEQARTILENLRSKQHRDTNEKLLDREILRQAAIRAGLDKPEGGHG